VPGFNIPLNNRCDDRDAGAIYDPDADEYRRAFNAFRGGPTPGPAYTIETARKHRYRLEVLEPFGSYAGSGNGILLFLEKCTRPTPEIDEITIHNGQDEIYRPGKQRWGPVEFTFYETLRGGDAHGIGEQVDEVAERMYAWWGQSTIALTESRQGSPTDYYKRAQLQMLDGIGSPVWTYYLHDCWPQKITPIELAYSDTEIATITVTLRFNKAEEKRV
jgi:hypothetical protein